MRVATFNVNGIRARHAEVVRWTEREQPDVLCLQELKAAPEQVPDALTGLPEYHNLWHGMKGGYSGVSLHLRRASCSTPPRFAFPSFDVEARIVEATVGKLRVASVYVPNGNRNYETKITFLRALETYVAEVIAEGSELLLCGDLNVALTDADVHPSLRRATAIGQLPEERALLSAVIGAGVVDVLRARNPDDDRLFTWWAPWRECRKKNVGWRLDYVLATPKLFGTVEASGVQREYGTSDHAPVMVDFGSDLSAFC